MNGASRSTFPRIVRSKRGSTWVGAAQAAMAERFRENSPGLLMGRTRLVSRRRDTLPIHSVTNARFFPIGNAQIGHRGFVYASAALTRGGVNGYSRSRAPVASKNALAIAADAAAMISSPAPVDF